MSSVATKRRRRIKAKNVRVGDSVEADGRNIRVGRVFERDGDILLREASNGPLRPLGARFSPDTFLTLLER